MNKVLFLSNHAGFSKFNAPYMKWFKEQRWTVDNISPGIEIEDYVDEQIDVAITRNPLSIKNFIAYKTIKKKIQENGYDIIHCHTPVGGLLGRLCTKELRKWGG
jgi:glycosyltransferase EpsD